MLGKREREKRIPPILRKRDDLSRGCISSNSWEAKIALFLVAWCNEYLMRTASDETDHFYDIAETRYIYMYIGAKEIN